MSQIEEFATREEWLARRRQLVTASDVAAILGVDPHRDALSVYADKIGAGQQEDSLAMRRGRRFEAAIAEEFAEQFGVEVVDPGPFTIFTHPNWPWIGATIDRYYLDEHKNEIPVQIKLGIGSYANWKEEVPKHYQVQVMMEAFVMGANRGMIAGLIGPGPLVISDVAVDHELIDMVIPKLDDFMDRVERREPPEPTSELALEPLRRLYPGADGRTIELFCLPLGHEFIAGATDMNCGATVERLNSLFGHRCGREPEEHVPEKYAGIADEWERAKAESKHQDEIASGCQAVLRHMLGTAQWGKLSDGSFIERKINKAGADSLVRFRPKRRT